MDDEPRYRIPAASIGDTDLGAVARRNPDAAREIARLEDLMHRGEESKEEFFRLCRLLFDVGSIRAAEYLLRRNIDCDEGRGLYTRLFGTEKQEEFETAVSAFESQFDLTLVPTTHRDFLVTSFHTSGGPPRADDFALLSEPCEIEIGYVEQDRIQADVILLDPAKTSFDPSEYLILTFVNGVWEMDDS